MLIKQIFIDSGYEGIVELLIENGASIDVKDNFNCTPLIYAAIYGNFQIDRITK